MKRVMPLPCLFSDSDIYIKQTVVPGRFYFEKEGELCGYFKKSGNGWIWFYKLQTRRFPTLSKLFEDVAMRLE